MLILKSAVRISRNKRVDHETRNVVAAVTHDVNKRTWMSTSTLDSTPSGPVRARPDRALKLAKRKVTRETVVKTYLSSLIADASNKRDICTAIRNRSLAFSPRLRAASLGLTYIIKQLFHGVQDVRQVQVPNSFFDATFVRQLMLGTADAVKPDARVRALHDQRPELLSYKERYMGDRNIYSAGARLYCTNLKNHLIMNLERFMIRVCKAHPSWSKEHALGVACHIRGYLTQKSIPDTEEASAFIHAHRSVLGFVGDRDGINPQWYKSKSTVPIILRYFVYLGRTLESFIAASPLFADEETTQKERSKRIKKRFDIVPICQSRAHFITIDTSVLYGILRELKLVCCKSAEFEDCRTEHWNSVFKLDRLKGKGCEFTETINSDGLSACVHMCRPVDIPLTDSFQMDVQYKEGDWVAGIDPGGTTIMHAAVSLPVDPSIKPRQVKLTRKQYYVESGITRSTALTASWNADVQDHLDAISTVSSRGVDFPSFVNYLTVWNEHHEALWTEYTKPRWSKQRMRLYGGKNARWPSFSIGWKT